MSDITKKLRALLRKAEGTTGAESDSFMTKVRELMVTHQVEMHTLRQEDDPMGAHVGILLNEDWAMGICNAGAEYLGCATVFAQFDDSSQIGCRLYGRKSACITATHMLAFWINEVERMAERYELDKQSVGNAMTLRLIRLLEKDGPAPSNGTDLVPIDAAMAAALSENETESRAVEVRTDISAIIVAEQISLSLQAEGPQSRKALAETGE